MAETITTRCCIAGGGPAGMMLGFLLARAGIDVIGAGEAHGFPARLPRRHHPSLDARADARAWAARRIPQAAAPGSLAPDASRSALERIPMVGLPPSADALQIHRADAAVGFPQFPRRAGPALSGLPSADADRGDRPDLGRRPRRRRARQDRRTAISKSAPISWSAATAAIRPCASARGSRSRKSARRSTCCGSGCRGKTGDTEETGGHIEAGQMMVMLNRGDYWQCAYVIPKGGIEAVQREGLPAFRERVVALSPFLRDRVGELKSLDDIKLLTVAIDRLRAVAPAGPALHRRCRACDVAGRRRRHQSRGSGRGRRGQYPGRAAARRRRHDASISPPCRSGAPSRCGSSSACR